METRKNWIVCTFDDGYKGLIDFAMPILDEYGFTATVFVCTGLIGKIIGGIIRIHTLENT